jgi:hypothetical protein
VAHQCSLHHRITSKVNIKAFMQTYTGARPKIRVSENKKNVDVFEKKQGFSREKGVDSGN